MNRGRSGGHGLTLYLGAILTPRASRGPEFLVDGGLLVDNEGRIRERGHGPSLARNHPKAKRVRLGSASLLIPGFVDTHTHLPQYSAAGRFDLDLLSWLEREIYPLEARFEDANFAVSSSKRFFAEMIRSGTTSAAIYSTVHSEATEIAFQAAHSAGVRAIIGKVMMDANAPAPLREETSRSLEGSRRLCKRWNGAGGGRLHYAFTPRFAVTCTRKLMTGAAKLARKNNVRVQTHLAETRDEVDTVRKMFPDSESYTDVYGKSGLIQPGSIFAHGIYLAPSELSMLAAGGAGIAHCPLSNIFLGSGLADARASLRANLPLGLGSDVAGGPTLDMFRQMAAACYVSKVIRLQAPGSVGSSQGSGSVTPEVAFTLATLGGARVLGLDQLVGSLEPGKQADFQVIDYTIIDPDARPPSERSMSDVLSLLCYRGHAGAMKSVYVGGRRLNPKE